MSAVDRFGNTFPRNIGPDHPVAGVLYEKLSGAGHDETLVDALFAIAKALERPTDDTLAVVLEQGLARVADALEAVADALAKD